MRGKRKFILSILYPIFYIGGAFLTTVPVEGGILVSIFLIAVGGNVLEHGAMKFQTGNG